MSDKALSPATLELTQRIQVFFPRNLNPDLLRAWNGAPGEVISACLLGAFGEFPESLVPEPPPPLLVALPPIQIPVLDRFVGVDGTVYVSVSPEFHEDFDGIEEEARPASTIYPHSNTRPARYAEMRKELGEGKIVKATLGQIAYLAKNGGLITGGRANLFEVVNKNGVPRLVSVGWCVWYDGGGWRWNSYSVGGSGGWSAGQRVFSGDRSDPGLI